MYIYDNIWLNSSLNEKCLKQMLYRKSKHIFLHSAFFFFRKSYDNVKNTVEPDRPQMTI
jgi:hypothetical protein